MAFFYNLSARDFLESVYNFIQILCFEPDETGVRFAGFLSVVLGLGKMPKLGGGFRDSEIAATTYIRMNGQVHYGDPPIRSPWGCIGIRL